MDFANDLCIFAESYWDIEKYVNDFCVEVSNVGLRVNTNNTKELCGSMDNITKLITSDISPSLGCHSDLCFPLNTVQVEWDRYGIRNTSIVSISRTSGMVHQ